MAKKNLFLFVFIIQLTNFFFIFPSFSYDVFSLSVGDYPTPFSHLDFDLDANADKNEISFAKENRRVRFVGKAVKVDRSINLHYDRQGISTQRIPQGDLEARFSGKDKSKDKAKYVPSMHKVQLRYSWKVSYECFEKRPPDGWVKVHNCKLTPEVAGRVFSDQDDDQITGHTLKESIDKPPYLEKLYGDETDLEKFTSVDKEKFDRYMKGLDDKPYEAILTDIGVSAEEAPRILDVILKNQEAYQGYKTDPISGKRGIETYGDLYGKLLDYESFNSEFEKLMPDLKGIIDGSPAEKFTFYLENLKETLSDPSADAQAKNLAGKLIARATIMSRHAGLYSVYAQDMVEASPGLFEQSSDLPPSLTLLRSSSASSCDSDDSFLSSSTTGTDALDDLFSSVGSITRASSTSSVSDDFEKVKISGDEFRCWLRSAWYVIFHQMFQTGSVTGLVDSIKALYPQYDFSHGAHAPPADDTFPIILKFLNLLSEGPVGSSHFDLMGGGKFQPDVEKAIYRLSYDLFEKAQKEDQDYYETRLANHPAALAKYHEEYPAKLAKYNEDLAKYNAEIESAQDSQQPARKKPMPPASPPTPPTLDKIYSSYNEIMDANEFGTNDMQRFIYDRFTKHFTTGPGTYISDKLMHVSSYGAETRRMAGSNERMGDVPTQLSRIQTFPFYKRGDPIIFNTGNSHFEIYQQRQSSDDHDSD